MSSLDRMLAILDVLVQHGPVMSADSMISKLGYSRGTGYRYIKALMDRGLLQRLAAGYGLGPRIIELDFELRESDPVLTLVGPIVKQLSQDTEGHVLLTQFFDDRVVVTVEEIGVSRVKVSYGRGRRLPLFRGAPSKAILAILPRSRQRKLFDRFRRDIAAAGMGKTWDSFRANLMKLARSDVVTSVGELDKGNVGIAVAMRGIEPTKPMALVLVFSERHYAILDKQEIERRLQRAKALITERLHDHVA